MDMETTNQVYSLTNYLLGAFTLGAGIGIGYVISKIKKDPNNAQISGKEQIELTKLEHIENEREHTRKKELEIIVAERDLQRMQLLHSQKLESIDRLTSLVGQDMLAYNEQLKFYDQSLRNIDPELLKKRQEYRDELLKSFVEDAKENYDAGIYSDDFIVSDDDKEKINGLVDLRFPITAFPSPKLPDSLNKAIDFITNSQEY